MTVQELINDINDRYANDVGYVSSIIERIEEYVEDHELDKMPNIQIEKCVNEEIERGLWGYVGVDGISIDEFVNNDNEKSALILEAEYDEEDDILWLNIIPNVDAYDYYVGD